MITINSIPLPTGNYIYSMVPLRPWCSKMYARINIIHSMQIEGNMMTLCMLSSLHWINYNDFITRNHLIAGGNCNEFPCSYKQCFACQDKQYLYNDTYWREIIYILVFIFRITYSINIFFMFLQYSAQYHPKLFWM